MVQPYEPSIFKSDVWVVRLGYFSNFKGGHSITVGDRIGGLKRGLGLPPEYYELLSSVDPTVHNREFTLEEQAMLCWMDEHEIVSLIRGGTDLADFGVIPVPRQAMTLVEDLRQGYRIRVGDLETISISELGARFLPLIDGHRTLGEIAAVIKRDTLANPSDRNVIRKNEEKQGRTFDSFLREEAFIFIRQTMNSGAMTFESTV